MRLYRQSRIAVGVAILTTVVPSARPLAAQATPGVCQCASSTDTAGGRSRFPGIAFLPLLFFVPLIGGTPAIPAVATVPAAGSVAPAAPVGAAPVAPVAPLAARTVALAPVPDSLPYGVRPPNTATIFPALALAGALALVLGAAAGRLAQRGKKVVRGRSAASRSNAIQVICYAGGAALLFVAALSYVRAGLSRSRARSAWADMMQPSSPSAPATQRMAAASIRTSPASGEPVARLRIPAISLDEVVVEGVDNDALDAGPGHFPGSAMPGEQGNSIISAHRDRQFNRFDELAVGDTVATQTPLGVQWWTITRRRIVPKDERSLFPTRDATLTLTTCWPVRYVGPAPERLLLTAKPLVRLPGA